MTLLHQAAQKAVEAEWMAGFDRLLTDYGDAREDRAQFYSRMWAQAIKAHLNRRPALQHQEVPREPVACKHCGEQQPWVGLCDRMGDLCGKAAARDHAPPSTTRQQTPTHHADCPMAKPGHSERLWNCNCGPLTTRQQEAGGDTRAAFEAWARGYYFDLTRCDPCYVNEPYKHAITDWCWLAWLAAAPSTPEKAGGVTPTAPATGDVVGWKGERHTSGVPACVAARPAPSDDWSVARDCAVCGRMATPGGPCQRAHGVSASVSHPLPAQANDGGEHG